MIGSTRGNSIRAVDVFVDALELRDLGFDGVDPAATGRPAYQCFRAVHQRGMATTVRELQRNDKSGKPNKQNPRDDTADHGRSTSMQSASRA
jgi:hypothetical protein